MPYPKRTSAPRLALLLTALLLAAAAPAGAAPSLLIWPMDPVIEPDHAAAALWLENRGDAPILLQVRIFGWTQQGGEDDYASQTDIVPSPPVVQVPPGTRQLVRLTGTGSGRPAGETLYRVVIDEIPVAAPPALQPAAAKAESAIRFQMRYSLPLYVYGSAFRTPASRAVPPALRCTLEERDGRTFVRIANDGVIHARIADARFDQESGAPPLAAGLLGYVLPGSTMSWPLPAGASGEGPLSMAVNGNVKRTALTHCSRR